MKFRVWHKNFKRYLTPEEWFINFDGELLFFDVDWEMLVKADANLYTIQRYTGCSDKDKLEVWEGDLVEYEFETGAKLQGVVSWIAGMFVIDFPDQTDSGPIGFLQTERLKVIGCING